jgi:transketolase N-terminal domain/subunit
MKEYLGGGYGLIYYHLDNLIAIVDYNKVMAKGLARL